MVACQYGGHFIGATMDISSAFFSLERVWLQVQQYLLNNVLTWAMAVQLVAGGFAFLLAHKAAGALRSWIGRLMVQSGLSETDYDRRKYEMFFKITDPFLSVLFLGIAFSVTHYFNWPEEGLKVLLTLSFAAFLSDFSPHRQLIVTGQEFSPRQSGFGPFCVSSILWNPYTVYRRVSLSQSVKCMFRC